MRSRMKRMICKQASTAHITDQSGQYRQFPSFPTIWVASATISVLAKRKEATSCLSATINYVCICQPLCCGHQGALALLHPCSHSIPTYLPRICVSTYLPHPLVPDTRPPLW
jgi:hypothetical protein